MNLAHIDQELLSVTIDVFQYLTAIKKHFLSNSKRIGSIFFLGCGGGEYLNSHNQF